MHYVKLLRRFIPGLEHPENASVRERAGIVACIIGIIINFVLFIIKYIAGTAVDSIAIRGEAINSLTDTGSSIISMLSFRLAGKPADAKHPFGHQRIEYVASTVVALFIFIAGYEVLTSSIDKIVSPEPIEVSWVTIVLLSVSIALKLLQRSFYSSFGKYIGSEVLTVSAADSLSDVLSTSSVLAATIISYSTGIQIDGYMGVLVALMIFWTGFGIIRDSMNNLLGRAPDPKIVGRILDYVKSYSGVLGIHDLMIHDYGPARYFVSLHIEVSASNDIMVSHDMIDNIEHGLQEEMGLHVVIHMDPVVTDDKVTSGLREYALEQLREIDPLLEMDDFRAVIGKTHDKLIFDVIMPGECKLTSAQVLGQINERFNKHNPKLYSVVYIDQRGSDNGKNHANRKSVAKKHITK